MSSGARPQLRTGPIRIHPALRTRMSGPTPLTGRNLAYPLYPPEANSSVHFVKQASNVEFPWEGGYVAFHAATCKPVTEQRNRVVVTFVTHSAGEEST